MFYLLWLRAEEGAGVAETDGLLESVGDGDGDGRGPRGLKLVQVTSTAWLADGAAEGAMVAPPLVSGAE